MTDTELPVELQEAFRVLSSAKNPAGDGPDPESLGSVYEQLRAGTLARRQAGAHYTPSILTGPIVAATLAPLVDGLSAGEVLELRIVDPAMGAGAFLAEACRYLADVYVDRCGDVDPVRARRRVAEHCIHGVDVDPIAVTLARRVLWLVVGDPSLELDFVDHALRCGDALVGEGRQPEESRVYPSEPFHWHEAFPKVFHRGGFHAVVGNPPFRNSVENRMAPSASHKRWWRARWPRFSAGSADQSRLFWARTLHDLLGPGGRYGMISPTALLSDAGEWQAWMFEYWRPDHLWLQPVDQFPGARIRTTTIIGGQGVCASVRVQDRERDPERPSRLVEWAEESRRWYSMTRTQRIELSPERVVALSHFCRVHAGCATATAYELRDHLVDSESGSGARMVSTGALDRYRMHWGRRQRFLGKDYTHPRWPDGPSVPASVSRARERQAGPKILVGGLTRVLESWLDTTGDAAGIVSTWVIRPRGEDSDWLSAILVVLNSPIATRLYRQDEGGASMSGLQVTIKKRALASLPLPRALGDPRVRSELASLANALVLAKDERDFTLLDRRTAARVGELYGRGVARSEEDWNWWFEIGGFGSVGRGV